MSLRSQLFLAVSTVSLLVLSGFLDRGEVFASPTLRQLILGQEAIADPTVLSENAQKLLLQSSDPHETQQNLATTPDDQYILGPGDVIQIDVFNVPEYSGSRPIAFDGTVSLPRISRLAIAGLTPEKASEKISSIYAKELKYPIVSIIVTQRRPLKIVMNGEIGQPGVYTLAADMQGQLPTIVQAIQSAGGLTQTADAEAIALKRRNAKGELITTPINLLALMQQGDWTQNIFLRDGDMISIPAAPTIDIKKIEQLSISNLRTSSTLPVDISITGEVSKPGPYRFNPSDRPTMISAIKQAGGISLAADIRQVQLRRLTRQGAEQLLTINLWEILQTGDLNQDILLQQGDKLTIPIAKNLPIQESLGLTSSTLASGPITVGILGEVKAPGSIQIKPNTSLNQALLAAGGFNGIAKKKVKLIRFNTDGTVTNRDIRVDFNKELNSETNPILRPNDIVMVGQSTWGSIKNTLSNLSNNLNFFLPYLFFLKTVP